MAQQMKADDEVRTRILAALIKKGSVQANISQVKKNSKMHKATIKTSIDFLMKEGRR